MERAKRYNCRLICAGIVASMLAAVAVSQVDDRSVAEAGAGGGQQPITARLVRVGEGNDYEPGPWGTLITGPEPADHYWVQGLSAEDYEFFLSEGQAVTGSSVRRIPAERMIQLAVERGDEHRLIAGRAGADPGDVADLAFDLEHLPEGVRFVPVTPNATTSASYLDGHEPEETMTRDAALVDVTWRDGSTRSVVRVPGPAAGLAGLLRDLRVVGPDAYAGEIETGQFVTILGDPLRDHSLVVAGMDSAGALAVDAGPIAAAVAAAIEGR